MSILYKSIKVLGLATVIALTTNSCSLDRFPESDFSDADFWNTENDLKFAANRMYQQLNPRWLDSRADDNQDKISVNQTSNGSWSIPATSGEWDNPYDVIFTANNILEKGGKAGVTDEIKNRYFAEARFFRALSYFDLVQRYGDVPLVTKTLDYDSEELTMGRTPKEEIAALMYEDLEYAKEWLPDHRSIPEVDYGRVSKSTAMALKARIALFLGTFGKFHGESGYEQHLQVAVDASDYVMGQGHKLFADYGGLFRHEGEGKSNTENLLVKIYGESSSNLILGHNYSRDLENGRVSVTRNLIRQFLYSDGLPAYNEKNELMSNRSEYYIPEAEEETYNSVFENRDPRLTELLFQAGDSGYKGVWIPTTSLGSSTAYAPKKGFSTIDQEVNGNATTDRILLRYGEVLLINAEAKYELNGSISDADLDKTINALRKRAGFEALLTNAFVNEHGLNMREEIRRERNVELAIEGTRYADIIRWKLAETVLVQDILGAKYDEETWAGADPTNLNLNQDGVMVVSAKSARRFDPSKDYLYPIPLNNISLSGGNVVQNPNWK